MNLQETIEILGLYEHAASSIPRQDFLKAVNLGIEALKHTQFLRKYPKASTRIPLKGETKD